MTPAIFRNLVNYCVSLHRGFSSFPQELLFTLAKHIHIVTLFAMCEKFSVKSPFSRKLTDEYKDKT